MNKSRISGLLCMPAGFALIESCSPKKPKEAQTDNQMVTKKVQKPIIVEMEHIASLYLRLTGSCRAALAALTTI